MKVPYNPPATPAEPLASWKVNKFRARLGEFAGCGCGLLVFGFIGSMVLLGLAQPPAESEFRQVTGEERALVFDAQRIVHLTGETIDPNDVTTSAGDQPGGIQLEYFYDPDPNETLVYSLLWLADAYADVPVRYQEYREFIATNLGPEVTLTPVTGACNWGHGTECGIYVYEGAPVGNYLFGQNGKVAVCIQVLNTYGETVEDLDSMFLSYLESLEPLVN